MFDAIDIMIIKTFMSIFIFSLCFSILIRLISYHVTTINFLVNTVMYIYDFITDIKNKIIRVKINE